MLFAVVLHRRAATVFALGVAILQKKKKKKGGICSQSLPSHAVVLLLPQTHGSQQKQAHIHSKKKNDVTVVLLNVLQ